MLKKANTIISMVLTIVLLISTTAYAKQYVKAEYSPKYTYDDLKGAGWAVKSIEKMSAKGLIKGVGHNKFSPLKPVTHLEALVMVLRALDLEEEGDKISALPEGYQGIKAPWGNGFITLAYEKGLLTAEELKAFNPMSSAKRYEIAKYLVRALGYEELAQSNMDKTLNYNDWNAVPYDARGYVYVAVDKGIIKGDGINLYPNSPVTRAEMAALLERLDDRIENGIDVKEVEGIVYAINTNTITVKIKNSIKTFLISNNIPVYDKNNYVGINQIKVGYEVRLIFDSKNNIIFIEIKNSKSEEVIPIELNEVKNPPEKVAVALERMKNVQNNTLIYENGTYYIIATRGMMRTGGYTVNIKSAQIVKNENGTTLEVEVNYADPLPGALVIQAITNPYDIKSFRYGENITNVVFKSNIAPNMTRIDKSKVDID